ncbi:MAG: AAA family ATPase [Shewanella sp.]|uniref:AAA family ATPase n=1 Tax=Shewanella sp. TaxID=50422 RepID=UPI003F2B2593
MKLVLENIGALQQAEITLTPLCVLAGENDNGKSTVGKIVFCIIKAMNRYREDLQESKEALISDKLDEIYFFLRKHAATQSADIRALLRSSGMLSRAHQHSIPMLDTLIEDALTKVPFTPAVLTELQSLRDALQAIIEQPEDLQQSIENAFNKAFAAEFDASLLRHGASDGVIKLLEDELVLIHLHVNATGVSLVGEVEPLSLKDATFIDSPLILNQHDLLIRSQTLLDIEQRRAGLPYTTLHTKDLFNKLIAPLLPVAQIAPETALLLAEIETLITGEISYERRDRDFVFQRGTESISIKNTASGIKVFGLLQILLANEFIRKNTVLILDEPENHLHPKWQLKLAAMLVKLVECGVQVVISSHSPYLIEALKRGVDRTGLSEQTRFALAHDACITDEDRLSDIFSVLAEPFEEFSHMDAEDLRGE